MAHHETSGRRFSVTTSGQHFARSVLSPLDCCHARRADLRLCQLVPAVLGFQMYRGLLFLTAKNHKAPPLCTCASDTYEAVEDCKAVARSELPSKAIVPVLGRKCSARSHGLKLQDIGCCFGQDTRQLTEDGWKPEQVIALDLVPDYWYSCLC